MQCIASKETGATASSLAWHPSGNALAMGLESGVVEVWENPVPAAMTGPVGDPEVQAHWAGAAEEEEGGLEDSGVESQDGANVTVPITCGASMSFSSSGLLSPYWVYNPGMMIFLYIVRGMCEWKNRGGWNLTIE